MNNINDDVKDQLSSLIRRTNDDFGLTLSGNELSKTVISKI